MIVKGILLMGWLHAKNLEGLKLLCSYFSLKLNVITSFDDISKFNHELWFLFITDKTVQNIFPNKLLVSGPHVYAHEFTSDDVIFNCLSRWCQNIIFTKRRVETLLFPFPIDYFQLVPDYKQEKTHVLVYIKNGLPHIAERGQQIINECIKDPIKTFTYGSYEYKEYIDYLKKAKFIIFIIGTESQGFAVQEAMCMNVPLIVYDAKNWKHSHPFSMSDIYNYSTPSEGVTVWDERCGFRLYHIEDLRDAIERMKVNYDKYYPREIITEKLSITKLYYSLLNEFSQPIKSYHLNQRFKDLSYLEVSTENTAFEVAITNVIKACSPLTCGLVRVKNIMMQEIGWRLVYYLRQIQELDCCLYIGHLVIRKRRTSNPLRRRLFKVTLDEARRNLDDIYNKVSQEDYGRWLSKEECEYPSSNLTQLRSLLLSKEVYFVSSSNPYDDIALFSLKRGLRMNIKRYAEGENYKNAFHILNGKIDPLPPLVFEYRIDTKDPPMDHTLGIIYGDLRYHPDLDKTMHINQYWVPVTPMDCMLFYKDIFEDNSISLEYLKLLKSLVSGEEVPQKSTTEDALRDLFINFHTKDPLRVHKITVSYCNAFWS